MVDQDVELQVKSVLSGMFPGAPAELVEYAFKCKILDVNKCRIAIIKRFYYQQKCDGLSAQSARDCTAIKFCISEKTVENIIYNLSLIHI